MILRNTRLKYLTSQNPVFSATWLTGRVLCNSISAAIYTRRWVRYATIPQPTCCLNCLLRLDSDVLSSSASFFRPMLEA